MQVFIGTTTSLEPMLSCSAPDAKKLLYPRSMHGQVPSFCPCGSLMIDWLQIAGGINAGNAKTWIERGAGRVIVTTYLFPDAKFSLESLIELEKLVGKDRLVVDVRYMCHYIGLIASCRRREGKWFVTMNRWQTITDMEVNKGMSCKSCG